MTPACKEQTRALERPSRFRTDVRRLARLARYSAEFGAVLAVVCHLLPPRYRPVCELIASLCRATGG